MKLTTVARGFIGSASPASFPCPFRSRLGRLSLALLRDGDETDVDLSLSFPSLLSFGGGGGRQRQGEGRRADDLGLGLGQEPLLRRVRVLVGQEGREEREGAVARRAVELRASLGGGEGVRLRERTVTTQLRQ